MDRALPRPLELPWLRLFGLVVMAAVVALNFYFLAAWLPWAIRHGPWDYPIYVIAAERVWDGTLYQWGSGYIYPYSPVFAVLMVPFAALGDVGFALWRLAHVGAVLTIPSWPIRIAILLSWPFLNDTWEGNVNTFMAVAAYWAIRGNRIGGWSLLGMAVMIPKLTILPGVLWLLFRDRGYFWPFAALALAHGLAVLLSGYAPEWIGALLGSTHDMNGEYNFMPSVIIGWWWAPIGLALAAWLWWRGHVGWASVAIAPYAAGVAHLLLLVQERRWPWWLTPPGIRSAPVPESSNRASSS